MVTVKRVENKEIYNRMKILCFKRLFWSLKKRRKFSSECSYMYIAWNIYCTLEYYEDVERQVGIKIRIKCVFLKVINKWIQRTRTFCGAILFLLE